MKNIQYKDALASDIMIGLYDNAEFNSNNSLATVVDGLGLLVKNNNDKFNTESVSTSIESFSDKLSDKLYNNIHTDTIDAITDKFAEIIHKGLNNLSNVQHAVTKLRKTVEHEHKVLCAKDPLIAEYNKINAAEVLNMNGIDWHPIDDISELVVRENLYSRIGRHVSTEPSEVIIDMLLNSMPGANPTNEFKNTAIKLSDENRDRIVNKIYNRVKTDCTKKDISDITNFVFSFSPLNARRTLNTLRALANGKTCHKLDSYIDRVRLFNKVLPLFTNDILDMSNSTTAAIVDHLEKINPYIDMMSYLCMYYRKLWKDAILVPGPYINSDKWTDYKNNNGTVSDIVQYVNRYYKDAKIPVSGIRGNDITTIMDKVRNSIKEDLVLRSEKCKQESNKLYRDAYLAVMFKYLDNNRVHASKKFCNLNTLDQYVVGNYDCMNNVPVENRLYNALLNFYYPGSIEQSLYNRLSTEYTKATEEHKSLTTEDKALIEAKVYSEMITEFLIDNKILIV